MKLSTLFRILLSISAISACEIVERNALLEKRTHFYPIVHSIDDIYNGSLSVGSLLKFLNFKNPNRKLPFLLKPVLFEDQLSLLPDMETDVCGKLDVRMYRKLLLKHDSMTGVAYACHNRFKTIYKIIIVTHDVWVGNEAEWFHREFEGISREFSDKVCDCEKIVDDFKMGCLQSVEEDFTAGVRILILILIFVASTVFGILKFLLKNSREG